MCGSYGRAANSRQQKHPIHSVGTRCFGFSNQRSKRHQPLTSDQPGVQAASAKLLVHGKERLCVLKYSAPFLSEQIHSLSTSLAKTTQSLRRLSMELAQPDCTLKEVHIRNKIGRWLSSAQFLDELIRYDLRRETGQWRLQFDVDSAAFNRLIAQRLGRTVLMTNRMEWNEEQVVEAYGGQQQVEKVFRGLKDGDWLGWGPMYHWTDSKIRVNAGCEKKPNGPRR